MSQLWVYHENKEPIIINDDEADSYYKKGWHDSPAGFVKVTDFGVKVDDPEAVQILGESLMGVKDMLNGALNLKEMKPKELKQYGLDHFDMKLKGNKSRLIVQLEALINGNG